MHISKDIITLINSVVSIHLAAKVLKNFWVGASGATKTYPKQFEHLNYAQCSSITIWLFWYTYYLTASPSNL